jgi:hypothetical protein
MAKTKTEEDARRPAPVARDGAYVMMLFATLVALVIGCVLLHLDNEEYGGKQPPGEKAPPVQPLGSAAKLDAAAPPPAPKAGGTDTMPVMP